MALILAIQPDSVQASRLARALQALVNEEVVIVDLKEAALTAIDKQVPDLVLVPAFMPPSDVDHVVACLRTRSDADHVQVLTVPLVHALSDGDQPKQRLSKRWKQRIASPISPECDPRLFADDVVGYLSLAQQLRKEIEQRKGMNEPDRNSERRRARRWRPHELPWVSSVGLTAAERADLIDISSGGVLVRTPDRPRLASLKHRDSDVGSRPSVTLHLASGDEVLAVGRIIRWHVRSTANGPDRYEVAFRFDESLDLYLPQASLDAPESGVHDMGVLALEVPPEQQRARLLSEIFRPSVTAQHELLAGWVDSGPIPTSLVDAVQDLSMVNAVSLQIQATLRDARRTDKAGAKLLHLANRW